MLSKTIILALPWSFSLLGVWKMSLSPCFPHWPQLEGEWRCVLGYFSFGETGTEGGVSKEDWAHWDSGLHLSLARRAKSMGRMGRPETANGWQPWSVQLITSSGDPARVSTGSCAQSLRKGMSVINGKGPDTIKGMSAFCIVKPA